MTLQEVRSSKIWKPDPVMQSNVELTNGRPDFEAILKDIQVSPSPDLKVSGSRPGLASSYMFIWQFLSLIDKICKIY